MSDRLFQSSTSTKPYTIASVTRSPVVSSNNELPEAKMMYQTTEILEQMKQDAKYDAEHVREKKEGFESTLQRIDMITLIAASILACTAFYVRKMA